MRSWVSGLYRAGGEDAVISKYGQILGGLTRLKQICCDYHLVPVEHLARLMSDGLSVSERETLLSKLEKVFQQGGGFKAVYEDGEDIMCLVCFDPLLRENAKITKCGHFFCSRCLSEILSSKATETHRCPMCRETLKASECVRPSISPISPSDQGKIGSGLNQQDEQLHSAQELSSKALVLLHRVQELMRDPEKVSKGQKCVVISQFTTFLDRLQRHLTDAGLNVCRVDGRVDVGTRAQQIRRFSDPSPHSPNVMLLSLRAGGVAIDLTAANHVFLMDQWWNPAVDMQAIDRVHRLGQKRDVQVWKFVVKDSIEENILELQSVKQALTSGIHSRLSADELRKTRVKALLNIFGTNDVNE